MARLKTANNASSTLASDVVSSAQTIDVEDISTFPNEGPFRCTIYVTDPSLGEIIEVSAVSGSSFIEVTRGMENTDASDWDSGDAIALLITSGMYDELAYNRIEISEQTANYELVLSDASKLIDMNVEEANILTVPSNSDVAFDIGTQILVRQKGAGQTTITPAATVTVQAADSELSLVSQYSVAGLLKIDTDIWAAFGDLGAAT